MSKDVDAVIAALRVVLREAEKAVIPILVEDHHLPGAWTGRSRNTTDERLELIVYLAHDGGSSVQALVVSILSQRQPIKHPSELDSED